MVSFDLNDFGAWDDRALLRTWNQAAAEYKRYHSINALGLRVEDVLRENEEHQAQLRGEPKPLEGDRRPLQHVSDGAEGVKNEQDLEEGEMEDEAAGDARPGADTNDQAAIRADVPGGTIETKAVPANEGRVQPLSSIPDKMFANVKDEALKNLMMSWYYAGYYTGFYEGQQQAQQNSVGETEKREGVV